MRLHVRVLERFNGWFTSAVGVWQTFALTMTVVVLEFMFPRMDPHAFALMAVLTVYSGITQPMLAYVAAKSADRTDDLLAELRRIANDDQTLDRQTRDIVTSIFRKLDRKNPK